jgi:hypothetical protein
VRWHRAGFRRYWRWKSRSRGGRPQIDVELRTLIRQMSIENLLWGAPRIHGELIYAALYEAPNLVEGWRDQSQIRTNDAMLRNLMAVLQPVPVANQIRTYW